MRPLLNDKLRLHIQVPGTLLILAWVPDNTLKLVCFLLFWGVIFYPFSMAEMLVFAGTCIFFPIMDMVVIGRGNFYYTHPDFGVLPIWEIVIYGFYILHTTRMLGGPQPKKFNPWAWGLAILFSLAFGLIADEFMLTLITFALLLLGIVIFHEKEDFIYTIYFVSLGVITEYTGVLSGQWGYHGQYLIGIPIWFVTLWGSIGLLLRRIVRPIL